MTITKIVQMHKTLADKTRWEIFNAIWQHPKISGKELLVKFRVSQPTLSFHLGKLQNAEMIVVEKIGQTHHYSANVKLLEEALEYGQKALKINKNSR